MNLEFLLSYNGLWVQPRPVDTEYPYPLSAYLLDTIWKKKTWTENVQ